MHHDQDIRNMGGLGKYMPVTAITFLLATLALVGTPFFAGFYSKEHIIEAAGAANVWGAHLAYYAVMGGVFVTSLYSFRVYFLVFHGKERFHNPKYGDHAASAPDDAHGHDDSRAGANTGERSEEHTSELQSLMRISYAVFCLKKKKTKERK